MSIEDWRNRINELDREFLGLLNEHADKVHELREAHFMVPILGAYCAAAVPSN
jgi:chorismate mutase